MQVVAARLGYTGASSMREVCALVLREQAVGVVDVFARTIANLCPRSCWHECHRSNLATSNHADGSPMTARLREGRQTRTADSLP
jgi:hypothetical protein